MKFPKSTHLSGVSVYAGIFGRGLMQFWTSIVAVGAFKVIIELEVKRRDNDKKVNLLFLEMKNMMSVLLQ